MLQERDILDREEKCARLFRVQTEYREEREQITGFYIKRFFWSNYLEIVSQFWTEADGDWEAQFDSVGEEETTLPVSSEEEAQAAIERLNGYEFEGRALTVNEAKPQERRGGGG